MVLHIYPSAFVPNEWLAVEVPGEPEPHVVWAFLDSRGEKRLERLYGEVAMFDDRIHKVVGKVSLITHPPKPRRH